MECFEQIKINERLNIVIDSLNENIIDLTLRVDKIERKLQKCRCLEK